LGGGGRGGRLGGDLERRSRRKSETIPNCLRLKKSYMAEKERNVGCWGDENGFKNSAT